jgi:tRNA nucleotidyltransferase/poly(A) polymerase
MSDYIFMLESHLSTEQSRAVENAQAAAEQANVNIFLTGGAMRDMLAGFRIRDLDFTVEGNGLKVAKTFAERTSARILSTDETRKSVEMVTAEGVTVQIAMSRQEKYARTGAKPQITAATLQEDLRGRDFTCNAIALSLNKASRGLLLDPMNGLADLERRELRLTSPYGLYDDPSRLLRLIRFRVRLGFTIEERTQMQVGNAREAEVEKLIPQRVLAEELKCIATEDNPSEIVRALAEAKLLPLFSPALEESKVNLAGLTKLEKIERLVPDESRFRNARIGPFLYAFAEKLSPKEKLALAKKLEFRKDEIDLWQKLETRAKKLETALRSARIRKPSQVYFLLTGAVPDEILFQLYHSALKPVQERMRNYFQKYLPALQEITPEEWAAAENKAGARRGKARDEFIANRLDRRPRKPAPVPPPPPPPAPMEAVVVRGRR